MWPFTKQPKIVETKTFSCPGMEGFTFEYPVFEEWGKAEVSQATKTSCVLTYYYTGTQKEFRQSPIEIPINLLDTRFKDMRIPSIVNPNKIPYEISDDNATFYIRPQDFNIKIVLANTNNSFPRNLFFQTIIDSFRIESAFGEAKNNISKKKDVNEAFRNLLPEKGLIFISGGITIPHPVVYIVDLTQNTIVTNGTEFKLTGVGATALPMSGQVERLITLSNAIWASKSEFKNFPPKSADWDVRLILSDGEIVKDINSYGPPVAEVSELYDLIISITNPGE